MKPKSTFPLLGAALAMLMATTSQAEIPDAPDVEEEAARLEQDLEQSLDQGLDRDRAAHRAEAMERRRLEEEERRKGAGLDRERARARAEKLEERR